MARENAKMMYSGKLWEHLLGLSDGEWRSLVADMRWRFMQYAKKPNDNLRRYMDGMPDAEDWRRYSRAVTAERRAKRIKERRDVDTRRSRLLILADGQ